MGPDGRRRGAGGRRYRCPMAPGDDRVEAPLPVPDAVEVDVPTGARVLVVSDLHLAREPATASLTASAELAQTVESWTGPGLVVLAGDCFDLLDDADADPRPVLATHARLAAALRAFAGGEGRRVISLPGNHDSRLAWDQRAMGAVAVATGAELALAVDLHVATGAGMKHVRVEHGHQLDPANTFTDPRNPLDTPLGHHLIRDLLPNLEGSTNGATWLAGMDHLADPFTFPRFLASRLAYRRLGRHAWWLVLPFVLAVILKLPLSYLL